jgi:hypothetical protein
VCLKFRQFQEEGHVMCFTWSAVSTILNHARRFSKLTFDSLSSSSGLELCSFI